jgi:type II secretory pathway component PulF
MFAVVVVAFTIWLAIELGAWFIILSVFLVIASAIGLAVVLARRGSTQQETLLWALAIAAERSTPLAPAALALAEQFGGTYRVLVQILAEQLSKGHSLPEALDVTPGVMSRDAELLVRVGWRTGALPQALRSAASARAQRQVAWGSILSRLVYLSVVLIHIQVVVGFISYFVAPKFEAIYKDFGISLPDVTIRVILFTHFLTRYGAIFSLLILAELAVIVMTPLAMFGLFYLDLPFIDYFFRRRHATLILRALALTAQGGRPITVGLDVLTEHYPSSWVRGRLRAVKREVDGGADWLEALGDHSLIRPADEAVLGAAQRVGNLPWALSEIADANQRRIGYRLQLGIQLMFPLVIIALGALVFLFAAAYFAPIVRLIEALAR